MAAGLALAISSVLSLSLPRGAKGSLKVIGPGWPPPAASPSHVWTEGLSAGPLGRRVDVLFERLFRNGLTAELGRDVDVEGYAGVMQICRSLVEERGGEVSSASKRVLVQLFPDVNDVPTLS